MIQGAVEAKARRIIAVDTNPEKFKLAGEMGATDFEPERSRKTDSGGHC